MAKFVNLTEHTITIVCPAGEPVILAPSGAVARCKQNLQKYASVGGVDMYHATFGEVEGLPPQDHEKGAIYIVSSMVREACKGRLDVASPGVLVRNEQGQPVGCRGLIRNLPWRP